MRRSENERRGEKKHNKGGREEGTQSADTAGGDMYEDRV